MDEITLMRNGDFYEAHGRDAICISDVLGHSIYNGILGIPYHHIDTVVPQLAKMGIATRIITPSTSAPTEPPLPPTTPPPTNTPTDTPPTMPVETPPTPTDTPSATTRYENMSAAARSLAGYVGKPGGTARGGLAINIRADGAALMLAVRGMDGGHARVRVPALVEGWPGEGVAIGYETWEAFVGALRYARGGAPLTLDWRDGYIAAGGPVTINIKAKLMDAAAAAAPDDAVDGVLVGAAPVGDMARALTRMGKAETVKAREQAAWYETDWQARAETAEQRLGEMEATAANLQSRCADMRAALEMIRDIEQTNGARAEAAERERDEARAALADAENTITIQHAKELALMDAADYWKADRDAFGESYAKKFQARLDRLKSDRERFINDRDRARRALTNLARAARELRWQRDFKEAGFNGLMLQRDEARAAFAASYAAQCRAADEAAMWKERAGQWRAACEQAISSLRTINEAGDREDAGATTPPAPASTSLAARTAARIAAVVDGARARVAQWRDALMAGVRARLAAAAPPVTVWESSFARACERCHELGWAGVYAPGAATRLCWGCWELERSAPPVPTPASTPRRRGLVRRLAIAGVLAAAALLPGHAHGAMLPDGGPRAGYYCLDDNAANWGYVAGWDNAR